MKATIVSKPRTGVIISLLVALCFGIWSVFLGQDKNWDLLNYHLYNPYAFLNDRIETDLAPAGMQTYFSPMLDIAYFTAISHLNPKTVGFLLGFLQGLCFFLVYRIAGNVLRNHRHGNIFALLLALAGVLSIGFQAEIGTTMHDSLVALFPLLSLWLILSCVGCLDSGKQRSVWIRISTAGFIAGTGIGLKLVSAIYALPLCLAFLVLQIPFPNRLKLAFVFGLSVLTGLFVTGGYWLYEVWRLFGNPLFPQFNNYFQGELALFTETRDLRFLPRTLFDKIFYPFLFTFDAQRAAELKYQQISWFFAYIAVLGLLVQKATLFIMKKPKQHQWSPESIYLLAFFCISYLLWLNLFGIYRYLIVIELLIPLLLFVIISNTFRNSFAPVAALVLSGALTVVNLNGAPDWGHADWADTVYRVEPGELTIHAEPAAIYLAGQPLAWLIPAMDIETPFIQLVPNMGVPEAYLQRAKILTADRSGKHFVIYESSEPVTLKRAHDALRTLDLRVDENNCSQLSAYLGSAKSEYRFCELKNTEPQ